MHGLSVTVQEIKYLVIGGPCRLFTGVGLARACGTGFPAMRIWAVTMSATLAPCALSYLSNLVSNIVQEMAQQTTHTQFWKLQVGAKTGLTVSFFHILEKRP